MSIRKVRAVLLDVDGTLIDSGYLHATSWWQAFRQHGFDIPTATLHRAIGMGGDRLVPHVLESVGADAPDDDDIDALTVAHDAVFACYWSRLRRLPGSREFVARCHDEGLTTVLASSAGQPELDVLRSVLDADSWIDEVTSAEDADSSKPEPDLVQVALTRAGVEADEALFVGDSVWDVEAAGRAGVRCVGVECGGTGRHELLDAGAVQVWRDPADLLEHWHDSPLSPTHQR